MSGKSGWFMASQKIAGTDVRMLICSSPIAWRKACTSKAGITTVVPFSWVVTISWLLQPVTWNSGTETRLRRWTSSGKDMTRRQVSLFDRKFSWVVIAPLGKPVVPLV